MCFSKYFSLSKCLEKYVPSFIIQDKVTDAAQLIIFHSNRRWAANYWLTAHLPRASIAAHNPVLKACKLIYECLTRAIAASTMWRALMPASSINWSAVPEPGMDSTASLTTSGNEPSRCEKTSSTASPRPPSGQ